MNDPRLEAMGDTPGSDVCGCTRVMLAAMTCEKCKHQAHDPGACQANVGTGYMGLVLCRCGA